MSQLFYLFIIVLRIICSPLIFFQPVLAIILSVFLDIIDGDFANTVVTKKQYQLIDKNLDLWWFINIMFFISIKYPDLKNYFLFLFIYRLIGQSIFYATKNRGVLLFFPNFFEWIFYLVFIGINYYPSLLVGQTFYIILALIIIIKIYQEWFLHVADLSLKEIVFKTKRDWKK